MNVRHAQSGVWAATFFLILALPTIVVRYGNASVAGASDSVGGRAGGRDGAGHSQHRGGGGGGAGGEETEWQSRYPAAGGQPGPAVLHHSALILKHLLGFYR